MQEKKKTPLSDLGKQGLIGHIAKKVTTNSRHITTGIGDDAAVLDYKNNQVVVSTNMMCEGIHFDLTYHPLKHLGYKAVIIALSNIYAMNATPSDITVALGLSAKYSLEALDELYEGILKACKIYNIDLVGGDLKSSLTGMNICITATGKTKKASLITRNNAQEGDYICVTGDLGSAYAGLQLLEREKEVFEQDTSVQPKLKQYDYIIERQLKPEAKKEIIKILKDADIKPTSMISMSSGLASELLHLCKNSNVGCSLQYDKIPAVKQTINIAEKFGIDPVTMALNGGEDHEILFTVKPEDYKKLADNELIKLIGEIKAKEAGKHINISMDKKIPLKAQGWPEDD